MVSDARALESSLMVEDAPTAAAHSADGRWLSLARRAAENDRAAQRALFNALRQPMHATLYRVLGSNRGLEDLLQEAFIELFRSLPSFRGEAKLTTWADRITARVAYRHLRRPELVVLSDAPASASELPCTPEVDLHAREGVRRLYAALGEMRAQYRIAFALFWIDGRSIAEVADVTGVSAMAAKSRIWRARRWLQTRAKSDAVLAAYLTEADER